MNGNRRRPGFPSIHPVVPGRRGRRERFGPVIPGAVLIIAGLAGLTGIVVELLERRGAR